MAVTQTVETEIDFFWACQIYFKLIELSVFSSILDMQGVFF